MTWRWSGSPRWRPQMPNLLRCVLGLYLFVNFHFPHLQILPVLSTLSPPTCPLSHFTPLLPLTEEVNKKLSHRGQNAVIVTKAHERNTNSEHTLYLCIRQSRLARRIMPSVRLFVRSFVCYQIVNVILLKRMNWFQWNPAQGHERSTLGARRSKVKVTGV